jgi:hypothetical protein
MLLRIQYHRFIRLLRHVRADLRRRDVGLAGGGQRQGDTPGDLIELAVGSFQVAVKDVGDQEDAAARMVEGYDGVGEEVDAIGDARASTALPCGVAPLSAEKMGS